MKWEESAFELLKTRFGKRIFSVADALSVLSEKKKYSRGTVYRLLHDLNEEGFLERVGRGFYRIREVFELKEKVTVSDRFALEFIPNPLIKVADLLKNKGIEFMITGATVLYRFHHYLPRRLIHLIYVIKGAGENTVTILRESGLRALLNPSRGEISLALENFPERDIFVIREFSELRGNINGIACYERALVDLYFESTRERIPYPKEEVARIFSMVLRSERINLTRLFMLASRRGIKEEMKAVVKFIEPKFPVRAKMKNKYVKEFLRSMERGELR